MHSSLSDLVMKLDAGEGLASHAFSAITHGGVKFPRPDKEPTMLCYEVWRALWMDIRVAYSGLCVVLLWSCFACADCCTHIV
jgi:hypothetical protein